jgi:phenylacetate-CoA ligase
MKIWAKQKMSHPFLYKLQNIIPVDVLNLDDKQLEKLVKKVEGLNKSYSVLGYVSALEQVVRYFEKNSKIKINAKIESVITMSEGLNRETKEKLQRLFDCPVVSRYSNLENGIIAQQECNDKERFLINTASYCVDRFV